MCSPNEWLFLLMLNVCVTYFVILYVGVYLFLVVLGSWKVVNQPVVVQ